MFFALNNLKYVTIYMVILMQSLDEKVLEKDYQLDLDKFDDLLNFDNLKEDKNALKEEKSYDNHIISKNNNINKIDFSIFDKLLDDFTNDLNSSNEKHMKNISIDLSTDDLIYIKDKIRYYELKIENTYNLDNIERDEKYVIELNKQLMNVKDMYMKIEKAFNDKVFESKEELLHLINKCKMEILSLETVLNVDYKFSNNEIRIINDAINKQDRLLKKLKFRINYIDEEIKLKDSLVVIKKMIYNSFKMLVGLYFMNYYKDNFIRVMLGSLFILNSIIGIRKAINNEQSDLNYYKYKDYDIKQDISKNIDIVNDILLLANKNITTLQIELKEKFSSYKEYFHDYEEIYFSICNIKSIIEKSCQKLSKLKMEV